MFDVVASLGYNCEISFRLENYFGQIDAYPFSWSYVMDRNRFPAVLHDRSSLFTGELKLMEDEMIRCENTLIKFHPRYDILRREGTPREQNYEEAVTELRSRVAHLKEKFTALLASDKRTLFLLKVEDHGSESNAAFVRAVYEALEEQYVSHNYLLVAIPEEGALDDTLKGLENDRLKVRSLKKFAPRKHTDTMGDVRGWKRILDEFTEEKSKDYYKRLNDRRWHWATAVMKKYLSRLIR